MDLSIVIPAYNEAGRIGRSLAALEDFLGGTGTEFEILVVDDGSTDDTIAVVERLGLPGVRCIATSPNRGKGHAVRVGMLAATGRVRVMFDADASMPPSELPRLLAPIDAGRAELAIGSRYIDGARTGKHQPAWRRAWSRLANRIIQRSLVAGVHDTQCGFKAFTEQAAVDLFSRARIDGWAFDLEILALARRLGYSIAEVGITWHDDERSRVSPVRDFLEVVREWSAIRRNFRRRAYGRLIPARS